MFKFYETEERSKDHISTLKITFPDEITIKIQDLLDNGFSLQDIKFIGKNRSKYPKLFFFLNKTEPHVKMTFKKHNRFGNWTLRKEYKRKGEIV